MSFLSPLFLLGALGVAVPVILHLLRRDIVRDVPFTAVEMIRSAPVEQARPRRLRDLILLGVRVLALLLLATAFARPYRVQAGATSPLLVLAIDRSSSMSAPGVFERARAAALAEIDRAPGRVAVVAFDDGAEVVVEAGPAASARRAVEGLTPGYGATRFAKAIERAAIVAGGEPARVAVVTDLQRAGWNGDDHVATPSTLDVQLVAVDGAAANAAITALRTEPGRATATVRADGAPFHGTVTIATGDRTFGTAPVAVDAGAAVDVVVTGTMPAEGEVTARIDDATGYQGDNTRVADAAPVPPTRVLVIAGEDAGLYVTRALEAGSRPDTPIRVVERAPSDVAGMRDEDWSRVDAVALLSTTGLSREARTAIDRFVSRGGGLLAAAGPDVEPSVLASIGGFEPIRDATVVIGDAPRALAAADVRHPLFRAFTDAAGGLGQVRVARAWTFTVPAGWSVAASFSDGSAALLERSGERGRVLLFTSDLGRAWNDFPLHSAFVPFTIEAIRLVARPAGAVRRVLVGDVPAGVAPRPGVVRTEDGRRLVVNVDPRESAVARIDEAGFRAALTQVPVDAAAAADRQAREVEAGQSYWRYGLMLMLAALVAESFVGRA